MSGRDDRQSEAGAGLFLAVGLLAVLSILSGVFYSSVHRQLASHHRDESRIQALHIAEGGINHALAKLGAEPGFAGVIEGALGDGRYRVRVMRDKTSDSVWVIQARGWPSRESRADRSVEIVVKAVASEGETKLLAWKSRSRPAGLASIDP